MRRLARLVLMFERVWPAVAPALGLVGLLVCAALLGLPQMLPPLAHIALLVIAGLAVFALLGRGLRRVTRPEPAEADRRLEADSGLRHQPLAVLSDHPSAGGNASNGGAVWAAHVARARAQLSRLTLRAPRPMLAAADPRALRALVLIGLAASLGIAGPDAGSRLAASLHPGFVPAPPPPAPLVQAWITPPAYTGVPPIFLKPEGGDATVPAGSKLTVSVTGGSVRLAPTLEQPGHTDAFAVLDATSFQIERILAAGGRLAVRRQGRDMAAWNLAVVADAAPVVSFPEPPGTLRNGANPQTRLPWQVSHAYGVNALQAELHLVDRPDAPVLTIPIPLPGNTPKTAHGARVQDLTANPWAGLPVTAQLLARDTPGLEGRSETLTFTLPERRFANPVARAVAIVRRELSRDPTKRQAAIAELDRIAGLDKVWDDDSAGFLNLRAIASLLALGRDADTVPQAQTRLWSLALHLEEGAPERTARALDAARKQVQDALDAQKRGDKVDPTDLDRRIRELQEALQKRLDALSEQARRDPDTDAWNPDDHPLDQRDMQRLAEELRDSARRNDPAATQQKMAELDRLMEQMKNGRPEHGQMTEAQKKRAEQRARGQQQMSALQDMVQRQGALLDTSQSRAGTPQSFRSLAPPVDPDIRAADQRTQLALRRAVGELMEQYGDLTGEVPPNLGDADAAMRDSAQAIAESRDAQAAQSAQKAIEALQKGGQSMQQQMAQKFGRGQQPGGDQADDGDEDGDGQGMAQGEGDGDGDGTGQGQGRFGNRQGDRPGFNDGRGSPGRKQARRPGQSLDPLGRPRGEGVAGSNESGDVEVPEKMEEARTRELQDELRRRGADRSRTQDELDYIDRLLKQF